MVLGEETLYTYVAVKVGTERDGRSCLGWLDGRRRRSQMAMLVACSRLV
jgi:hypothetical protein